MRLKLHITAAAACIFGASGAQAQSLLVVNQGNATVSIVDPQTLTERGRIEERLPGAVHAHEVAVSPDGSTAFLPVYGDTGIGQPGIDGHEVLVADLATGRITGSIDFGRGVRPHQALLDANSGLLYVTTERDKSIAVIDPVRRTVVGRVPTGAEQSHMMVLSHDGSTGYTANVRPGSVSVLDMRARKLLAMIPVADAVQRIAISADDRLVFTADNTRPRLAVIDTAKRAVRRWIALPALGYGAAATQDGRWLLVALPVLNAVGVIDLQKMAIVRALAVGRSPQEVLIRPDQGMAYVSCSGDGTVAAIDLADWKVTGHIATASGADGLGWAAR